MNDEVYWLNGWQRVREGWALEAVVRAGLGWEKRLLPASWLPQSKRLFEPSMRPFERLRSRSFRVRVPDLRQLSPLLDPGRLVAPLVPPASQTRHAIYAFGDEERHVYLPAALLLRELWMWSSDTAQALLTPNSLAMFLQRVDDGDNTLVEASGILARAGGSDAGMRRLCWLAQSADAQSSWSSMLTFAHEGALRLRLPQVSLEAWAWGVELPTGTLIAELSAVSLHFELETERCQMLLGRASRLCPPEPKRRTGLVSF